MTHAIREKIIKDGYNTLLKFNCYSLSSTDILREKIMSVAWQIIARANMKIRKGSFQQPNHHTEVITLKNLSYTIIYSINQTKVGAFPILSDMTHDPIDEPLFDKDKVMHIIEIYDSMVNEIRLIAEEVVTEYTKDYTCHLIRTASLNSYMRDFPSFHYKFMGHDVSRIVIFPNKHWHSPQYYYDITDPYDPRFLKKIAFLKEKWHL